MKRALGVLAAGWLALLGVSLVARLQLFRTRLAGIGQPLAVREMIESGDPAWHAMLESVRGVHGAVLILAADASREPSLMSYRSAYERYPDRVRVVPVPRLPRIRGGAIELPESAMAWVRQRQARALVLWSGTGAHPGTTWAMEPRPGFRARINALNTTSPVSPTAEAPRIPVRLVLGWVVALGLFGWIAGTGRGDRWSRAGQVLVALAIGLALMQAACPQPAWSNWDAWAVWDLKTKAIRLEGWLPRAFLTDPDYSFAHQEAPPGWSWLVAWLSDHGATFDARAARLVSPLAGMLLAGLLVRLLAEVGVIRYRWMVAGAVTLLPMALDHAANGYVDWPLAAAMTGAMVLTLRAIRGATPAWAAGLAAGVPACLKNEGMVGGLACLMALALNARRGTITVRMVLSAAVAWAIVALPWQGVVATMSLHHYDYGAVTLSAIADMPHRMLMVARATGLATFGAGMTGSTWFDHVLSSWLLFWPVATLALLSGWRRLREPGLREIALILVIQVAGACLAYALTVLDVNWLLGSSLDRLLLQWTPAVATLAAAVAVRSGLVGE